MTHLHDLHLTAILLILEGFFVIVFTSELFAVLKAAELVRSTFCKIFPMTPESVSVTEQDNLILEKDTLII